MPTVLIVDDDEDIRSLLIHFFGKHAHRVIVATGGAELFAALEREPVDIVILDVMLQGEDGFALCRRLRANSRVPVIMLTAMSDHTDRVVGLELGADDYLTKPFDARELLARTRAVLRRSVGADDLPRSTETRPVLAFAGWRLDVARRELRSADNTLVVLSSGEFELLLAFAEHPQRVLTRDMLLNLARGVAHAAGDTGSRGRLRPQHRRASQPVAPQAGVRPRKSHHDPHRAQRRLHLRTRRQARMKLSQLRQDTIGRRYALTIVVSLATTMLLDAMFLVSAGFWAAPPITRSGLLERTSDIVHMMNVAPVTVRRGLADAACNERFRVQWYPILSPVPVLLRFATDFEAGRRMMNRLLHDPGRRILFFEPDDSLSGTPALHYDRAHYPNAYFMATELDDGSWLVFTALRRSWGIGQTYRLAIESIFFLISLTLTTIIATRRLVRPIMQFANAVKRFGTDPNAPDLIPAGPRELRLTIEAFNAMQLRIRSFVADRTTMLAAISHDLRTPLTRMRLRGEFIEDAEQQRRLFRDVDAMQAMVEEALAFFRDDASQEETTTLDLAELLRTIVDDYDDAGAAISYHGPDRVVCLGRPTGLRRVFVNLIDNALRSGPPIEIELASGRDGSRVTVRDHGPGITPGLLEHVFRPFVRLDTSRNRATGGVGLGLSSARSILRAHGGDVRLANLDRGGLAAEVTLPRR